METLLFFQEGHSPLSYFSSFSLVDLLLLALVFVLTAFVFYNRSKNNSSPIGDKLDKMARNQKILQRRVDVLSEQVDAIPIETDRHFLQRYVNIPGTKTQKKPNGDRRVTITQFVIQALELQEFPGKPFSRGFLKGEPLNHVVKVGEQRIATDLRQPLPQDPNMTEEEEELPDNYLSFLKLKEADFESAVENYGITLGDICNCGGGHCDWTAIMFSSFMVDAECWPCLESIRIYRLELDAAGNSIQSRTLVSTSSLTTASSSESGNYVLITMGEQDDLNALPTGTWIEIEVIWIDKRQGLTPIQRTISLRNRIGTPAEPVPS